MVRTKIFQDHVCDFVVVKPFNLILNQEQFLFLERILKDSSILRLKKEEQIEIAAKLKIPFEKRQDSTKVKYAIFKNWPADCGDCVSFLLCENYKKTKEPKIIISKENVLTKKHRQIYNLFNFSKETEFFNCVTGKGCDSEC